MLVTGSVTNAPTLRKPGERTMYEKLLVLFYVALVRLLTEEPENWD